MATVERYSSFEEMKSSDEVCRKKKNSVKETPQQKGFRKFIELAKKNIIQTPAKKNNSTT